MFYLIFAFILAIIEFTVYILNSQVSRSFFIVYKYIIGTSGIIFLILSIYILFKYSKNKFNKMILIIPILAVFEFGLGLLITILTIFEPFRTQLYDLVFLKIINIVPNVIAVFTIIFAPYLLFRFYKIPTIK
jgi:uncharacterized membrane protein